MSMTSSSCSQQALTSVADDKTILRSKARYVRDHIPVRARFAATCSIQEQLTSKSLLNSHQVVHSYVNIGSEVGTEKLIRSMLKRDQRVACPRVVRQPRFEHIAIRDIDSLIISPLGLREPDPLNTDHVDLSEIDVMLVPGLAFDRSGARLGYGGGYYDLAIKEITNHGQALVIGLAFEKQLVDKLPQDEHDQRVDLIVTEHQVISSKRR